MGTVLLALLVILLLRTFTHSPYPMPRRPLSLAPRHPALVVQPCTDRNTIVVRCSVCDTTPYCADVAPSVDDDELPVDAFTKVNVGTLVTVWCPQCMYALELALRAQRVGGR